jgi:hypothetical protein
VLVDWWLEREEGKVLVVGTPHGPQMRYVLLPLLHFSIPFAQTPPTPPKKSFICASCLNVFLSPGTQQFGKYC